MSAEAYDSSHEEAARAALRGARALNDPASMRKKILSLFPREGMALDGTLAGEWEGDELGMPPGCPVVPLGRADKVCYILTANGEVETLTSGTQKKSTLQLAFGQYHVFLNWAWPRWNAKANKGKGAWDPKNFDAEQAFTCLQSACSQLMDREGPWDLAKRLRGRGVWRDPNGLVVHLGDQIITAEGGRIDAGRHGDMLYAKKPRVAAPAPDPEGGPYSAAGALLDVLKTWNWQRPEIDPTLLLGWIGQAFISGALDWRSVVWLVGGPGTGKSTAMQLCEYLLCGLGNRSADATAPAIYRKLGGDAGAVILDESEGGNNETKMRAKVELARQAASGALIERASGANNRVQEFPVFCSFMFGGVAPPSMESADYSRMAMLELRPMSGKGGLGQYEDRRFVEEQGRELFGRMVADWDRVQGSITAFRERLIDAGHSRRGGDAFGGLLGCAHVLLADGLPDEAALDRWAELLDPETLAELEMASSNWSDAWSQLLGAKPRGFQNLENKSVGAFLNAWRERRATHGAGDDITDFGSDKEAVLQLRRRLAQVGLGIICERRRFDYESASLFVPNISAALGDLTQGSDFHGRAKLVTALRQMPDGWVRRSATCRVEGQSLRGIAIKLSKAMPREEENEDGVRTV